MFTDKRKKHTKQENKIKSCTKANRGKHFRKRRQVSMMPNNLKR